LIIFAARRRYSTMHVAVDVGRISSRGGKVDLSSGNQKYFSREGVKSDEILFCPLETKKTTFFVKHFIEKCKFQNAGEVLAPLALSPSDTHVCGLW